MENDDAEQFGRVLRELFTTMGYDKPVDGVIRAWWKVFQDVDLRTFEIGCGEFFATQTGRPLPARIRELMPIGRNLWPKPEEAWNQVPKSEADGGWMCREIAAAVSACADSLTRGDLWAARRAFVDVYERELRTVRGSPQWWYSEPSEGTAEQRLQIKLQALEMHPSRGRPEQIEATRLRLEQMSGSSSTERKLKPVLGLLPCTSQEKRTSKSFLSDMRKRLGGKKIDDRK